MTAIAQQAVASILDNTANVIEGSGSYTGIPGVYSNDELLKGSVPSNLSITATGATGKNTVAYSSGVYDSDRWVKTRAPTYWLLCYSATDNGNVSAARRVTAWTQSSTEFTVSAFPENLATGDKFYMLEGFRRMVDGVDIESDGEGISRGFDRRFHVTMEVGETLPFYGSGVRLYSSLLSIRVRFEKYKKAQTIAASVLENMRLIRDAVALRAHWESTYTKAIIADVGDTDVDEDDDKAVGTATLGCIYQVALTFK
jgi:hypothetical protein